MCSLTIFICPILVDEICRRELFPSLGQRLFAKNWRDCHGDAVPYCWPCRPKILTAVSPCSVMITSLRRPLASTLTHFHSVSKGSKIARSWLCLAAFVSVDLFSSLNRIIRIASSFSMSRAFLILPLFALGPLLGPKWNWKMSSWSVTHPRLGMVESVERGEV